MKEERDGMKRIRIVMVVVLLGGAAQISGASTPEMFSEGLNGWEAYDLVNERVVSSLSVENETLRLRYGAQSIPLPPEMHTVRAKASASGGALVGDYLARQILALRFRIKPEAGMQIELLLQNDKTNRRWRYRIEGLAPASWNRVTVPLTSTDLDPINGEIVQFEEDMSSVTWVGIKVVRCSDMAEQVCYLDDVRTVGPDDGFLADMEDSIAAGGWQLEMLPDADMDGDGMCNADEWVAGTAIEDSNDKLVLTDVLPENGAVRVLWRSVPGRIYRVMRTATLGTTGVAVSGEITATGETCEFLDERVLPAKGSFYSVEVKQQ
jgi:hypothetical protein